MLHAQHFEGLGFGEKQRVRRHRVQGVLAVACGLLQTGHSGLVNLECRGRVVISLGTGRWFSYAGFEAYLRE